MRKHEIELITALAEGSLEDETEARALIESSERARTEYEAQKTALDALASVPPAVLTDIEKAALHRDIWTELSALPVVARTAAPWYYRWSYAAAGLFVVIGIVAFLNTGTFSADDASAEQLGSSSESAAETTLASPADDGGVEAPAAVEESADAGETGVVDPVVGFFREHASQLRSGQFSTALAAAEDDREATVNEHSACLGRAGLDDYEALGEITFVEAGSYGLDPETPYLVAVPTGVSLDESTPVAFVDLLTCDLIHLDE